MRRRRLLLVLAALAILGGIAALLWLPLAQPEVSLTTLGRLKVGMSETEVAAIFGPPAADLTHQLPETVPPPPAGVAMTLVPGSKVTLGGGAPSLAPGWRLLRYMGRRATVTVEFDADGRLVRCHAVIHEVSALERVRDRMKWW